MTLSANPAARSAEDQRVFQLLIDGKWIDGQEGRVAVLDKFSLDTFANSTVAALSQAAEAVDRAWLAFKRGAPVAYQRGAILDRAAVLLDERKADFIDMMRLEAGFPSADAAGEVARATETLRLSGQEARSLVGDVIPMEGAPRQEGRIAFTLRVPIGIVAAITPFNSPLNTVTHKVAPAFAAGNPVILKPSSNTPGTSCLLAQVLLDAGMPKDFLAVLHGSGDVVRNLLADDRVRFFAFTGSTEVGRSIQAAAGLRRTQMELGSIAFTILDRNANLDKALPKVVAAGYRKAGQVCTSIQMLLVHNSLKETVEQRLAALVSDLKYGDPADPQTFVGPMISEKEAMRVEGWVAEAIAGGARRLCGGDRKGAVLQPVLLTDIAPDMKVSCSEIFGPVMNILGFETIGEAIERVNSTPYGLATGIFTDSMSVALRAARELEVGGVHVNETSSSRVDLMPYGGTKESGFGREGPHYAVRELTEERIVSFAPA